MLWFNPEVYLIIVMKPNGKVICTEIMKNENP